MRPLVVAGLGEARCRMGGTGPPPQNTTPMDTEKIGLFALSVFVVSVSASAGFMLRVINEPRCDADAIRTEYDAYRATTLEHLRHRAIADSLQAIEIDSLKALMDVTVPPVRVVLEGHRKAAQDAGLDTLRAGLLKGVD